MWAYGYPSSGGTSTFVIECAPATWTGRVRSASVGVPSGQVAWAVNMTLPSDGAVALAKLSRQYVGTGVPVAILVGTDVLSAPSFDGVISDGSIQITGGFTEASAKALAHRLTGG